MNAAAMKHTTIQTAAMLRQFQISLSYEKTLNIDQYRDIKEKKSKFFIPKIVHSSCAHFTGAITTSKLAFHSLSVCYQTEKCSVRIEVERIKLKKRRNKS